MEYATSNPCRLCKGYLFDIYDTEVYRIEYTHKQTEGIELIVKNKVS